MTYASLVFRISTFAHRRRRTFPHHRIIASSHHRCSISYLVFLISYLLLRIPTFPHPFKTKDKSAALSLSKWKKTKVTIYIPKFPHFFQ
ncbi:MAG TPA: hypothetical protein PLA88_08175, partial [Bacteroidales bacterium]|nr:hypothetical protein [Bacteroidales bacterium]